jgi:hypothetical protein
MTEAEWLTATDPTPLLGYSGENTNDRKLRLFACACCRRIWRLLADAGAPESNRHPLRYTVELGEKYADGLVSRRRLRGKDFGDSTDRAETLAAMATIYMGRRGQKEPESSICARNASALAAFAAARPNKSVYYVEDIDAESSGRPRVYRAERKAQAALFRDIFGNPFRPVAFDPRWRTADVLGLARGIYEERAFDRLPLLADALMDAGCGDEAILTHCRSDGLHVRGCWVVDLVLGKE